jgi:hypothetical protein
MVGEIIVNAIGLISGFGVAQVLGDFVESKTKPGIIATSTSQDKIMAGITNDGPKVALAYGLYYARKSSPFVKNIVVGSTLSTIFDVYWRFKHNGVPYSGYKLVPIETPIIPVPGTSTTPSGTSTTPTSSTSSGQSPGEPDIGLLNNTYFISDTDTLEDIMEKGRILEEM